MLSRITRLALSLGLVISSGVAFVPLGCGGSEEAFHAVPRPREDPKMPEDIATQLEDCVKRASAPFPPAEGSTYAIQFNVQVWKDGSVQAVEIKESMLGGHEVEGCFERVLAGMTLPKRTIAMGLEGAPPRGAAAPADRALVGHALAIPNPFSLLPVVLTFAAVCIVVAVTVHVMSTSTTTDAPPIVTAPPVASAVPTTTAVPTAVTVDDERARCKKVKQGCLDKCSNEALPTKDFGATFYRCMRACMEAQGCVY
jgi:hypothetical protein